MAANIFISLIVILCGLGVTSTCYEIYINKKFYKLKTSMTYGALVENGLLNEVLTLEKKKQKYRTFSILLLFVTTIMYIVYYLVII